VSIERSEQIPQHARIGRELTIDDTSQLREGSALLSPGDFHAL
jgi:hypothetical protein